MDDNLEALVVDLMCMHIQMFFWMVVDQLNQVEWDRNGPRIDF